MIKKLFLTLLLLTSSLTANSFQDFDGFVYVDDFDCVEQCCYERLFVDLNIGYFYPFSKPLREVISGGVNYQLQATYMWNRYFGVFASGDYFYQSGRSTGSKSYTSLWILPLTIGLRTSIDIWRSCDQARILKGYCLLGPRLYLAKADNSPNYLNQHNFAQGFGGVGGVGLAYLINQFTINAFVNCSFGNVRTYSSKKYVEAPSTQVGGVVAGLGIGWNF